MIKCVDYCTVIFNIFAWLHSYINGLFYLHRTKKKKLLSKETFSYRSCYFSRTVCGLMDLPTKAK